MAETNYDPNPEGIFSFINFEDTEAGAAAAAACVAAAGSTALQSPVYSPLAVPTNVGIAWKLSPTSDTRSAEYPLDYVVATIAVLANALVTVKLWMRRTNTALTGVLVCRGGQINGVTNDVSSSMTAAADTWEEITITFTPTENGVVEIEAWAYGGTTHSLYIDDFSMTQA